MLLKNHVFLIMLSRAPNAQEGCNVGIEFARGSHIVLVNILLHELRKTRVCVFNPPCFFDIDWKGLGVCFGVLDN